MVRFPFPRATFERTLWTVVVWFLFGVFVLGPLATVFAFSFTSSVLSGTGTFTLKWYGQLFSQPGLYGPLIRSFEIAVIVVVFQLMFGTIIAYSTVRAKIFGAKTRSDPPACLPDDHLASAETRPCRRLGPRPLSEHRGVRGHDHRRLGRFEDRSDRHLHAG